MPICTDFTGLGILEQEGRMRLCPILEGERDEVLQDSEPTSTETNERLSKEGQLGPIGSLHKSHG